MLNVNAMPCATCEYFEGIKQPDGTEETEYIRCKKAKAYNANEFLKANGKTVKCDKYREDD